MNITVHTREMVSVFRPPFLKYQGLSFRSLLGSLIICQGWQQVGFDYTRQAAGSTNAVGRILDLYLWVNFCTHT
jgi:hypothetical protein